MITLRINGLWTQFVKPMRDLAPFRTGGNMRGETGAPASYGRLPRMFRDSAGQADYTVMSYQTPIAWHGPAGWVMPPVTYSVSTSKQQGRIATALSVIDNPAY